MTGTTPRRLPRDLHPAAWWGWALGLAAAASLTTNPLVLLGLAAAAWLVVVSRRSARAWAGSFRLYAGLALMIGVNEGLSDTALPQTAPVIAQLRQH